MAEAENSAERLPSNGLVTETLQFENPRAVQQLYASDPALLKHLEDALSVRVTTREGWLRVEGESAKVDQARRVFAQLDAARQGGITIRKHEFQYALQSVMEPGNGAPNLTSLASLKIQTSARKAPVAPKTAGQLEYLQTIANHDVVFGVGPAGTGKTFLAMSAALAALRKEEVGRIILTRPAVEAGEALEAEQ